MTFDEIETALGQHLAAMTDCPPIAWPNGRTPGAVPYLIARHTPVSREDNTLDCSGAIQSGIFLVTIVAAKGEFTTAANAQAEAIAARFKKGLRLSAGAGQIVMNYAPEIVDGFHDAAGNWCVPVRARYLSE